MLRFLARRLCRVFPDPADLERLLCEEVCPQFLHTKKLPGRNREKQWNCQVGELSSSQKSLVWMLTVLSSQTKCATQRQNDWESWIQSRFFSVSCSFFCFMFVVFVVLRTRTLRVWITRAWDHWSYQVNQFKKWTTMKPKFSWEVRRALVPLLPQRKKGWE